MHKLIDYVCEELEEIEKKAEKGDLSMSEVQYADTLAHLKKNLLKGEEMMEDFDGEYSSDMRRMDGMSYRDGMHGGSYARGRGSRARRDSRGRYSSERGYSRAAADMVDELHELMDEAPNEMIRQDIQRLVTKLEKM